MHRFVDEGKSGRQRWDVRQNDLPEERQGSSFDCWVLTWWKVHHPWERRQKGSDVHFLMTDFLLLAARLTTIRLCVIM